MEAADKSSRCQNQIVGMLIVKAFCRDISRFVVFNKILVLVVKKENKKNSRVKKHLFFPGKKNFL